ncbi:MAG TPA: cupin domain-containing protein [Anaerolineae bacterium]|nr:cupin domain-containing protein [Anaerolineae bacterium]
MEKKIQVIHPEQRSLATTQTSGMRREAAISPELTGNQTIWVGLVTTPPGVSGGWHHHGDCESAIYVVSGRARFRWGKNGEESAEVSAGDFLAVPPNFIHHEEALGDEPFVGVVARGCSSTITVNVEGPES